MSTTIWPREKNTSTTFLANIATIGLKIALKIDFDVFTSKNEKMSHFEKKPSKFLSLISNFDMYQCRHVSWIEKRLYP